MNTPAHVFLAAAIAAKSGAYARNTALISGALFPDVSIFFMVGWERWVNRLSFEQIFGNAYFSGFWQEIFAVNNSVPVFALIFLCGLVLKKDCLWVFGFAALLHVLCDLPLHHDDGRPHFWPFTNWIYESPVSYWDPRHYGEVVGIAEALVSCLCAVVLLKRFSTKLTAVVIIAALASELVFSVGGHLVYG